MTKQRYIARSPKVAARMVGDELMIMSAKNSALFTLNDTGAALWNAADGHTPLGEIVTGRICAVFEVEPAQAQADIEELVAELESHGLVIVSDSPIEAVS